MEGYLVRIDFAQGEHSTVLVKGVDSMEQAIKAVEKTTSCPRVYRSGTVDTILNIKSE